MINASILVCDTQPALPAQPALPPEPGLPAQPALPAQLLSLEGPPPSLPVQLDGGGGLAFSLFSLLLPI